MATPSENITLYGDRAEQFRNIKDDLEDVLGHEPRNSQVLELMMADFDSDTPLGSGGADTRGTR